MKRPLTRVVLAVCIPVGLLLSACGFGGFTHSNTTDVPAPADAAGAAESPAATETSPPPQLIATDNTGVAAVQKLVNKADTVVVASKTNSGAGAQKAKELRAPLLIDDGTNTDAIATEIKRLKAKEERVADADPGASAAPSTSAAPSAPSTSGAPTSAPAASANAGPTVAQLLDGYTPGGDTTNPKTREEAAAMGFSVAKKPDSYDICFIPDGNTQAFLGERIGLRPGMIIDTEGNKLREHDGAWNYTIGQRKGLDIKQPAADGQPRYVTDINAQTGTVTVGSRRDLSVGVIDADRLKYLHPMMDGSFDADVQVRAHGSVVPCHVTVDREADFMRLELKKALQGVARGQAAVLYLPDPGGDIVLGSGTICGTASI